MKDFFDGKENIPTSKFFMPLRSVPSMMDLGPSSLLEANESDGNAVG